MQIIRHNCPDSAKNAVIALGNFDGVHRGHRAVIDKACEIAKIKNAPSAILTFKPHPRGFFNPTAKPFRITPFREKVSFLNVDVLFLMRFSRKFANISAEDFIGKILIETFAVQHIVIGYDFIFGSKRRGNGELLKKYSELHGVGFTQIDSASENNQVFSSTKIRKYLQSGEIENAVRMLGHDYIIEGRVVKGLQRGRELGFPTANIILKNHLRPAFGVYVVEVKVDNKWHKAIANIGIKPTFNGKKELLEVHIFDYAGDLYGKRLTVRFIKYIRPERKFDSISNLKKQIENDCFYARNNNFNCNPSS